MQRMLMKSKIHRATVTEANLQYEGSITIDGDLMRAADLLPFEKVQVVNLMNGSRIETYCMEGAAGSGTVCMNGPAARRAQVGDTVLIISYALVDESEARGLAPKIVWVNRANRILEKTTLSPTDKVAGQA